MSKRLYSLMKIYTLANYIMPVRVKSALSRIKQTRFLSELWSLLHSSEVFLIRGEKKTSNLRLTTLVFGDLEFSHQFAKLVYSEDYEVKAFMKTAYHNISRIVDHTEVDVILIQAAGTLSKFLSRRGFLILPKIRCILDISAPPEKLFSKSSRLRRRDIKKIKKLGFTYEIATNPEQLDFFYHKLYLPYISARHGKSAKPTRLFSMKQIYRKGGLLFVKLNGEYVSGILYDIAGNVVSARCLGIYGGRKQHLDEGAGQAALYFLIKWSRLQGFKEIDYGDCIPFMSDGLFAYKKSWGMEVKPCNDLIYGLRVSKLDAPVLEFLSENPCIFSESENLNGLIFRKDKVEIEKLSCAKSYYTPGLSRIVVGLYPERALMAWLKLSEKKSPKKLNRAKVNADLLNLWCKNGGKFFHKVYSS